MTVDPQALIGGGLVHLPSLVGRAEAASVAASFWDHLGARGVDRSDRSTWPLGALSKLQAIKRTGALQRLDTPELRRVGEQILGVAAAPGAWEWAPLVTFPGPDAPWRVPPQNWHLDEAGRGDPAAHQSLRLFVLLSDVTPADGATLAVEGSAALVRRMIRESEHDDAGSSTDVRKSLSHRYEWFRLLMSEREPSADARLHEGEDVDGVFCRVRPLVGSLGDVWCMDQWTLHNASPNTGTAPRFAATLFAHV